MLLVFIRTSLSSHESQKWSLLFQFFYDILDVLNLPSYVFNETYKCSLMFQLLFSVLILTFYILAESTFPSFFLIYRWVRIVQDGDSATFSRIQKECGYGNEVVKLECDIHLCRNTRTTLLILVRNSAFSVEYRKILKPLIFKMASAIKPAAGHFARQELSEEEKMARLRKGLRNIPRHYLGDHRACEDYFCSGTPDYNRYDEIASTHEGRNFLQAIDKCFDRCITNVKSLLAGRNNNMCEHINALVARNVGGKRLEYSFTEFYCAKCAAAVLSHNTGHRWNSHFYRWKTQKNPPKAMMQLEEQRIKKVKTN